MNMKMSFKLENQSKHKLIHEDEHGDVDEHGREDSLGREH